MFPASARAVCLNYCAAAALLVLGFGFYTTHAFYTDFLAPATLTALAYGLAFYLLLLPVYYATFPDGHLVKCRLFWRALAALPARPLLAEEKVALRAVLVKAIYLPLMVNWVLYHLAGVKDYGADYLVSGLFLPHGYWVVYHFLFLVDVLFFLIGYAVEHPKLGNEIRSVEPTLFGWVVALACYPPCFLTTQRLLGWNTQDYPSFPAAWAQWLAGLVTLLLVGVYVWSSMTLGFKASNLTHRGIVRSGPYAWVRHPAYVSKNLAWWLGAIPILMELSRRSPVAAAYAVLGLAGWSGLYYLRAVTEERHLGRDPVYQAYCERVRYRFIPLVW